MKPRRKRNVEAPENVKSFISGIINIPLENIQDRLSDFSWHYEKGDFHHWEDLFRHFDLFFEKHVKPRKDLRLEEGFLEFQDELPEGAILEILRVSRIIFEKCANKYLYKSHESLLLLLASTNSGIVCSALQTLAALVKRPAQSTKSVRWHGDSVFNAHLFSLSQGWGGKEEGLGLLSCAIEGGCDADAFKLASALHYEFYEDNPSGEGVLESGQGLKVIHIPDVHTRPEGDLLLFKQLVDQYHVPPKLRFSLFTRLRFARAFHSLENRRQFICIRLLAFATLLQSNPDHEDLAAFFVNEPEFVNELVSLLQSGDEVPEDIRVYAIRALAAQAQDRPRQSNVLNVVSAGGHRGILPSLVQKAVSTTCSIPFAEAIFFLVTVLVSSSAGCASLREAGLIPTLLPLLKDTNPERIDLVISAVHILEAFMDYSHSAGTLFRDLGGLDDTIMRLQYEVIHVERRAKDERGEMEVSEKDKSNVSDIGAMHMAGNSETLIPYRHRLLLKALLRAIALGTYASGNTSRLQGSEESALPACLCTIFTYAKEFGGGVFSLAASVMSDLINKDPTCFPTLDAAGLPTAFLESITAEVLPSSDVVGCIPHALDALCLSNIGMQKVLDSKALECFVKIFTSRFYLKALSGDTPAAIASGLDELMRHAPPLRDPGVDACINILKRIRVMGGGDISEVEESDLPTPMDMDSGQQTSSLKEEIKTIQNELGDDAISEAFLLECINNSIQMLETMFQTADTCRAFIEKKGIEDLLKLYSLPRLPISFGGTSTAYNLFLTFRSFSSHHGSALAKAICKEIKENMRATASSLVCMKFSDIEAELRDRVAKNLSAAECFLSLAAFLVRSVPLMMTEINSGGSDLFDDIGSVQRWTLWQISLVNDKKIESKTEEESVSKDIVTIETHAEVTQNENETESGPVLRYVSTGSSRSRWGFEPDTIPLLSTEQHGRRSRRETMGTELLLNHAYRLASSRTVRSELGSNGNPLDILSPEENPKLKSSATLYSEMMTRLSAAARGLYAALSKAMTVPSRHRDDAVTVSPAAKAIASSLACLFLKNLEFNGMLDPSTSSSSEVAMTVKCRYLGKVVEDITAVIIDSKKKTCNTIMVNCLYSHGTLKELLTTFEATSQLLWTTLPMETEADSMEAKKGDNTSEESWLLDTLKNYTRLMEYLVTSSTLLVPVSTHLTQQMSGSTIPVPKDPHHFVLALQAQVLEVVLPVWNHPMFIQCNPSFIESVCSIIKHIYSGVTDLRVQQTADVGIAGDRQRSSPPDESAISLIVEMGFPRSRAEEALRRVGNNRVELAMEWLFGHPEEAVQEEDELARALALSLGSGNDSVNEDPISKVCDTDIDAVRPQLPPIHNMLASCLSFLNSGSSNGTTFSLADLMITMCTRNKGEDREKVISYLVNQLKLLKVEDSMSDSCPMSIVSHLLALILSEDTVSREVAAKNGIVNIVLEFLGSFKPMLANEHKLITPKWVTSLFLVLDFMLQHKPKLDSTIQNLVVGSAETKTDVSKVITEAKIADVESTHTNSWEAILGKPSGYMTEEEQKRTLEITCNLLSMPMSASCAQAILPLCARLTKVYSMAMRFLDAGGLTALLCMPTSCLFPGFENVSASIIRHLLEDPQTLQQAMESEIRHTLTTSLSRHNNLLSPRTFLTTMARVVARDPAIFMQAATAVCQIEESGGRSYVVLLKDKEKEKEKVKEKEKEKEKEKGSEKEKEKEKLKCLDENTASSKTAEGSKPSKGHKRVPQSFAHVMEQLLDIINNFVPSDKESVPSIPGAMEVDEVALKGKGKTEVDDSERAEKPSLSESSATLAKVTSILKLITDIILMYSASSNVLVRYDTETSQGRSSFNSNCAESIGHGGFLHGILHKLVPNMSSGGVEKSPDHELKGKLSGKAVQFLVAVCMRSAEGRRRLFSEISRSLSCAATSPGKNSQEGSQSPDKKMRAFVDLLNTVLLSHTSSSAGQAPGISTEMAKGMLETDMVQALTTLLQLIDLDHPDAPKLVSGIAKALEALTRAASLGDHMHMTDSKKNIENVSDTANGIFVTNGQPSDILRNDGILHGSGRGSLRGDLQMAIRAILVHDEQLDHDMGLDQDPNEEDEEDEDEDEEEDEDEDEDEDDDGNLEAEAEEFMHDADEVIGDVAAAMNFRMDRGGDDDLGEDEDEDDDEDDDEDMDGDAGDEDDGEEDEQDEDELEDEVALSPADTDAEDPDDHELEGEYDEDMAEEDEEDDDVDDDWRENHIIGVQWRDGANGFNHIEVLGHADTGNQDSSIDPLQGMNFDQIFGAFRPRGGLGRRGSTYRVFDRTGPETTRSARHPLLNRTSLPGSGGLPISSSWVSTGGSGVRGPDSVLNGGLDASRLYTWYDSAMNVHGVDGIFGDRGVGQDGIFLDIPMLPRVGRRSSRADGQFSSWADDGEFQGGAANAALAQAFEEQFVSHFSSPNSGDHNSTRPVDPVEMTIGNLDPSTSGGNTEPPTNDNSQENSFINGSQQMLQTEGLSLDALNSGEGGEGDQNSNVGLDVHMQDEQAASSVKYIEAASQDSSGSGATVGESLRSLEVEIGSMDGRDESDRRIASDNIATIHPAREATNVAIGTREGTLQIDVQSRDTQAMDITSSADASDPRNREHGFEERAEETDVREDSLQGEHANDTSLNSIDPTFLQALPQDLRAEVLGSQQTRTRAEDHQPPPIVEDIDPEFLAALPPEIQAEVIAQQRAQRLLQSQLLEGHPVDMDSASIIATFPAELREEVLLTSSESVLSALPPALLAEAQLLRERAMSQLQSRNNIFGLSQRLGGRRDAIDIGSRGISAAIDRAVGSGHNFESGRRTQPGISSIGKKGKSEDGKQLVDTPSLKAILRLLRLAQPLGKGILQRLLYNLCSNSLTCTTLVYLLLQMLRPDAEKHSGNGLSADGAPSHRLYGCLSNVVYARPPLSYGVPPLVSRRILEILTYLAKHQSLVASLLLHFETLTSLEGKLLVLGSVKEKGKEKVDNEMAEASSGRSLREQIPLILLLKLLNQPLYSRSSAHLEQVLGLIEAVTSKAAEIVQSHVPPENSSIEPSQEGKKESEDDIVVLNTENAGNSSGGSMKDLETRPKEGHPHADHSDTSTSKSEQKVDPLIIFLNLPADELCKLCLLLAREGLSDLAYTRVSEVLNKIADIAPPHRHLFIVELAEAAQKLSGSAIKELEALGDGDDARFGADSMAGAAILRVLGCLSSLKASDMVAKEGDQASVLDKDEDECFSVIRNLNTSIEPLWQALSTCSKKIESRLITPMSSAANVGTVSGGNAVVTPPLSPGTQRVLPFIEGFFVLCDKLRAPPASQGNNELLTSTACEIKEIASSASIDESTSMQQQKADDKSVTFVRFADKHRRLLNAFIRQNPGLLEKSLSLLLKTPRLIDFDNKRAYFRSRIRHQHEQQHYSPLRITVRRAYVLEDSYNQLRMRTSDELKGRLTVQFQGEEGIDAGGLTREWYQLLSRVIFDKGALLFTTVGNESSFQPNPNSVYQTEHLSYFKFVGRVVAKALFDGQLLDVYFTRSFYKHILGVKVTYHDIEAVDPDFYKSLMWVLENIVNDILGLTFSIDADEEKHILYERTEVMDHELIPGGRNIRVTEENKHEYVDLVAEHRLTTAIRPQINAFLEGFNELISRDLVSIFNDKELELLISGLPEIDLEDLKANTEYTGYTTASPVVQWFWEVVRTFGKEDMARLLQFITGTSKVPLEGFKALQGVSGPQKFQIHKAYGAPKRLPSAHTCFNQLDLPEYSSKDQLQERLLLAIHEGSEGFGFG